MSEPAAQNPYAIYFRTWWILLIITGAMLASEAFHMPRLLLVVYLLAFMLVKAAMIGGNFMHLRHERTNLVVLVAVGLLVTSLIFVLFTSPEAASIAQKSIR
jgi:cytochrome c oxidase subunit IV